MRPLRCPIALRAGPAALAVVLALAACSTPPPVHLHTLMPPALSARDAGAAAGRPPLAITLQQVSLPAQVDQPQWLVSLPGGSLVSLEQERWAAPLRDEFRQALLEELIAHSGVVEAGRPVAGAPGPVRVAVSVRRFDSLLDREARIEGSWTLTPATPQAVPWHCEWLIREAAGAGIPALAAAHRRAVVRLGDEIGDSLSAMARGAAMACPPADPR